MGTVSLTTSEYVGDVSRSESVYFECFEDFLQYEEYKRKLEGGDLGITIKPVVPQMLDEENDGWIEWNGENVDGPRDISGDTLVEVRLRSGEEWVGSQAEIKNFWTWEHDEADGDIIEYRVIKEEDQE